jgi:tetratricopeptide (TPR) repeat protein
MIRLTMLAILLLSSSPLLAVPPSDCWMLRKHGQEQQSQSCFQQLLRSNDAAVRAEGYWGLGEWDRSNEQFRIATQTLGSNAETKVRWGMLLHDRFNNKEAADLFREALAKDPSNADAYIGMALISAESFDGNAMSYVSKALAVDPKNVRAHELAANLALDNDERGQAAAEADKALALDNEALDAMAVHAAIEVIGERSPDSWLNQIRSINPHYGLAYSEIAHHLELHYRHEDAAAYYRKAVAAEPDLWSAHSSLGIALMRLGQQEEAQKELELSYNNGYRNAATVNSLRLLDSYRNYVTVRDGDTILKLKKTEAELMRPYLQSELHAIISTYSRKYAMTLPQPIQLEVYPDHEDFAVRTMGMPGLGALGVTFGEVIAIDSPSARRPGDFNWGATLWHEMSHAYVLTATRNHVPRWFTEGLAVHEEGERSSEWKNRATPDVLIAIRDKKLLPILQLDRGFVYPQYPSQVVVSYFQAGTICDFIKERWGESKLLEMVHSYAALHTTPEVIQGVLATTPQDFDKQYLSWLDTHYGAEASHFADWQQQMKTLTAAAQNKQWDIVVRQGPAVLALYPDYVGDGDAYEILADAHHALNDPRSEAVTLLSYEQAGGQNPATLKQLANLQEHQGDAAAAAGTLARINYIYPVNDPELHRKLGDLFYGQKHFDRAINEYTAALASNPVDKAGVQYLLARAYLAIGNRNEAEERVLAALEIAPGYLPAQKLLMELHPSSEK